MPGETISESKLFVSDFARQSRRKGAGRIREQCRECFNYVSGELLPFLSYKRSLLMSVHVDG